METAEAEGQATKVASGDLEERTAAEDEAGGRAGKSDRRPGNMAVVVALPPPWLLGEDIDNFFPKYNALQML